MTAPQAPRPKVPGKAPASPAAEPGEALSAKVPNMPREQLLAACERGLDLCRFGNYKEGLAELASLGDLTRVKGIPSAYFSYLGYALAKQRNQVQQGIKLCKHAIKLEFFQTENYINLARTCLLSEKYRREAWDAVREGLRIDPESPELLALQKQLGSRRPPVLTFLGRSNPVNRLLGSLRHLLSRDIGSGGTGGDSDNKSDGDAGDSKKNTSERRSRNTGQVVSVA